MNSINDNGLAVARDVSEFFECEVGTEDQFRETYSRVRADHDADAAQMKDTPEAAPAVVLSCGDLQVSMAEVDYVEALAQRGLTPPADGMHSTLAVLWLAEAAEKRGLTALAKKLMDLRQVGRGLIFVRRPDGAFYTPKPVTAIKVARASEADQQAVAADVEAYFAVEEPAPR